MSPKKKSYLRKEESALQERPKRRKAEEERLKRLPKFRSVNVAIPLGIGDVASGGNAVASVSKAVPSIVGPISESELKEGKYQKKKVPRLLPPGAAIPSVSAAVPLVAKVVPLVSEPIPLVSGVIPLVSNAGRVTLPVAWRRLPSREWGKIKIPVSRKRRIAPIEMSLSQFLCLIPAIPFAPMGAIKEIAEAVQEQAEEERDPKVALVQELLELKMRREMGEISKEEYERKEKELDKRLEELNKL
ncbi:MAG: gas vesicle protein GvpG [Actinobacteria bacterium]|nr:gas vesicle protein GvpG [Actinomycetota bacterium]